MTLVKWQPFRSPLAEFDDIRQEFDRFFCRGWPTGLEEGAWTPALDVIERENEVIVKAELPGLGHEDIDLSIVDNTLTLKGEKRHEAEKTEGGHYRSERVFGSFQRTINLPSYVDADKVAATFKDGVLDVRLPKREEAKVKKINVNTG